MANSNDKNNTIEPDDKVNKTVIIEQDQPAPSPKSDQSQASSQKQLLILAKTFSLDGAFLPESKQAPLEDRSYRRKNIEVQRQQQNMEAIILRAMHYCPQGSAASKTDQDWFSSFMKLAEGISNATMQDLWAKILAGEISQPGSFSLKTMQTFRTMSITEAKLLAKACSLAMTDARKKNIRVFSGAYQIPTLMNFFNKRRQQRIDLGHMGLSYADILTLADNHLMFEQETESHAFSKGEKIQLNYNGKTLQFQSKKSDCILTFYKFTPIGTELAHLVSNNVDENYLNVVKEQLAEHFIVSE